MPMTARTASLIGAPTDIGASDRGASMGPEALRVAGIHAALCQRGLDVVDCGNVTGPPNPGLIKVNGYRNLTQVTAWNHEVHDAVYRELTEGRLPILLGGDHCSEHRLDLGGGPPLPRQAQDPARAVARRACRFQHPRAVSPAAACTACPCPAYAASARASCCTIGGMTARHPSAMDPPDRYSQRRCRAKGVSCTNRISKCSTCAPSTRWA